MHEFLNYKGFQYAQLNLFNPFTILIGPNGSGKSNAIEAIELFSFIANGHTLYDVSDVGRSDSRLQVRGGLQACPHGSRTFFCFKFKAMWNFEKLPRPYNYEIWINTRPKAQIYKEKLMFTDDSTLIFKTVEDSVSSTSGDIKVMFNNFARGGQKPKSRVSRDHSILSQYEEFGRRNNTKYSECLNLVKATMRYLKSSFVFDPNPKLMRGYERIGNDILAKDGSNLSAVLFSLSTGNEEQQQSLDRLLGWIMRLPDEPYEKFDFVTTRLNDVIFGLQESKSEFFVDASIMSDGTLRSLAVLTALETVSPNSRVIIEEFDNGLHPSRVAVLLEAIQDCCKRKSLNVLVTTHNPATLNALSDEQIEGVVLCAIIDDSLSFSLIKLSDLPRFDEFLERGPLGDLITRRIAETYLSKQFERDRKAKVKDWLRSLP